MHFLPVVSDAEGKDVLEGTGFLPMSEPLLRSPAPLHWQSVQFRHDFVEHIPASLLVAAPAPAVGASGGSDALRYVFSNRDIRVVVSQEPGEQWRGLDFDV